MSTDSLLRQPALPGFCQVEAATAMMAAAGIEARGAIFTRREVVDFILDLAGYTADQPLHRRRLLEPSMGKGDFLTPVIDRLLVSYERETAGRGNVVRDLGSCLCAVELHRSSYDETRSRVGDLLRGRGLTKREAEALCDQWLLQARTTAPYHLHMVSIRYPLAALF